MLKLTPEAAAQIRSNLESQNDEGVHLRVAARVVADGGIDYGMGFDEEREEDVKFTSEGVVLLVNRGMQELLEGATLDYVELEPGQFSFIFLNPNDPNYIPPKGDEEESSGG